MKDTIERSINLNAPIDKVWRALTDYKEFGSWFLVKLENPFETDQITSGVLEFPGYEGMPFWVKTLTMDAPHYFSFRWPYDEEISPDHADDPEKTTLVEFRLEQSSPGTKLTVKESGFNRLPEDRRLTIFRQNEGGWKVQVGHIKDYVEQ